MTSIDFEKFVLELLSKEFCKFDNYKIEHNKIIEVYDGNYQIDGYIEYDVMGVTFKTLLKCKYYKDPIKREHVQLLHSKIQSCGAHKGILVTSSSFQSGAIDYAKHHGIALIVIISENPQKPRLVTNARIPRVLYRSGNLCGTLLASDTR